MGMMIGLSLLLSLTINPEWVSSVKVSAPGSSGAEAITEQRLADTSIFYEKVVVCDGYHELTIYQKIIEYLREKDFGVLEKDSCQRIIASGVMRIYNQMAIVLKNPAGEVSYDIKVEIRHGKFKYTMYNLWFTQFQRDRYGVYRPANQEPYEVRRESFRYSYALFKKIQKQTRDHVKDMLLKIKEHIESDQLNIDNW